MLGQRCRPKSPRDYFGMDITQVQFNPTGLPRSRFAPWLGPEAASALERAEVDEWGVWWRKGDFHHFAQPVAPLRGVRGLAQLQQYPWPDLDQAYRWHSLRERTEILHAQGFAVAAKAGSVFEQSWHIRGFEELLMDLLASPAMAHWLFERTSALQQFAAAQLARAGADIIITGDDVAGQQGMLIRPELWREFLKPQLAATVRAVKAANPQAYVLYHSDGNLEAVIPDLIEIGIDILNPVQPECMDPAALKKEFGGRLSFWGTVSVQRTMPFGTPAAVRAEVGARVRAVACGGGLILAPAHVLGPETPWENIVAFFEAADSMPVPDH